MTGPHRNLPLLVPRTPLTPDVHAWATVTQASPLRIRLDGESTPLPFAPDKLISGLLVGDRVLVLLRANLAPASRSCRVLIEGKADPPTNNFLIYASAAARTAASTPAEGMLSYLLDAQRIDRYNGSVWVPIGGQYIGEVSRTSSIGTFTTTETTLDTVTFTMPDPAARIKVTWVGPYQSTVANDLVEIHLRWKAGASLDATGTSFASVLPNCDVAGRGSVVSIVRTATGITAGQVTVGATALRNAGSGNVTMFGSAQSQASLLVEYV